MKLDELFPRLLIGGFCLFVGFLLGGWWVNSMWVSEGLSRGWLKRSVHDDGRPYIERLDYPEDFRRESGHYSAK